MLKTENGGFIDCTANATLPDDSTSTYIVSTAHGERLPIDSKNLPSCWLVACHLFTSYTRPFVDPSLRYWFAPD